MIVAPSEGAALRRVAARLGFVPAHDDARRLVRELAADTALASRDAA